MSAHRKSVAPRIGARHVLGGAAMTAVFLGAGTGAAFATEGGQTANNDDQSSTKLSLDGLTNKVDPTKLVTDLNAGDLTNIIDEALKNHDQHGPNCGCHPPKKKAEDEKHPCPPEQKKNEGKKSESKPASVKSTPKVESAVTNIADTSDSQVESASTPSTDDSQVESASVDETTPVGAADTGDGSSSPGFTPTFTPAASSSPLDNPYALGGGAAAAALLGAYGVSVARRRPGAHRG